MAKPGPARRPALQVVREGNPGKRRQDELEGGVRLKPSAPEEPRWQDTWPPVRVPTKGQLEERFSWDYVEGSLVHIEDDDKRARLTAVRRAWMITNELDVKTRERKVNQRCRDVARGEWRQIVPVLDAQGLLATVDRVALVDHCIVVAHLDQANRDIAARGMWVQGERGAVKNPSLTAANQLRQQLKFYLGEFGLTPVARDGLNPGATHDEDDPFD